MLWNYLDPYTVDLNYFVFDIPPTQVDPMIGGSHVKSHIFDDGKDIRVLLGNFISVSVEVTWGFLEEEDYNKICNLFFHPSEAFGKLRSFKWLHPVHRKIYAVRFDSPLTDLTDTITYALKANLKILGRIES